MRVSTASVAGLAFSGLLANISVAQDFDQLRKALGDRTSHDWIYEDIDAGYAQAKRTGKPLLVCFR